MKKNTFVRKIASLYSRLFGFSKKLRGKGNIFKNKSLLALKNRLLILGSNNLVEVDDLSVLKKCHISIVGSNNVFHIGGGCGLNQVSICLEGDGNKVLIGRGTQIERGTDFAAIEGTELCIGEDCLFSSNIHIRTGDSHSIFDADGQRINQSKSVSIGNRVWVCAKCVFLKGATVADDCVVGHSALVTKQFTETNVILAGSPAKIVKTGITWKTER